MLQNIRDHAQGTIAKVIVFLIAITFALWGVESIVGGMRGEPEVAKVDGESITESQFTRALEQRRRQVLSQMGEAADPSLIDENLLRQSVLESLINEQILVNAVNERDLVVPDILVDQYIRSMQAFQQNGRFSQEVYAATLRSAGMLPLEFRQAVTRELLLQQLRGSVSLSAFLTQEELDQLIRLDRQTRDFAYLTIPYERFESGISIADAEVEAYFQERSDQFRLPERVSVNYLVLDKSSIADSIQVTDEELRARYEQEMAQAENQEERHAAHILIEVNEDRSEQDALAKARELREQLQAGADFAALAKEHSDDLGSAQEGGDLGYVTPGILVPEFDAVLFEMKQGTVSEPVRTEYGYHLIQLQDVRQKDLPSFEEMRDQIAATLRQEKAEQAFADQVSRLADLSYAAADLGEPAEALGLKVEESPLFSRQGGDGLFANPRLVQAAFSEDVLAGHNSDVIETQGKAVVLRLNKHLEPEPQPLEAVKEQIVEILKEQKARERAEQFSEQLIAEFKAGASLETIAEKAGVEWQRHQEVLRTQPGVDPEVLHHVFGMPRPVAQADAQTEEQSRQGRMQAFPLQQQYALVLLQGVKDGDVASYSEAERKAIESFIIQGLGASEYSLLVELLRKNAEISRS